MATADEIPTDLALEIGDDLDPKRFLATAREFFAFVESIVGPSLGHDRVEWRVKVREGSSILALAPAEGVLADEARRAYARILSATTALVSADLSVAALTDEALERARKLSDLSQSKNGPIPMRVWVCRVPILFGPDVGDFIREETRPAYTDFGSVEGVLNAIQDGKGGLELRIRDPLWSRAIKCLLPEGLLGLAMETFRQRVELFGEIHYRKDDTPESIRVERLDPLPNDDDLPSIQDVRGLLADGVATS